MSKVLIIGGSGFIGRQACARLLECGHAVGATFTPRGVPAFPDGIQPIPCDLREPGSAADWPRDCESIVFLAQARHWRRFPEAADDVFGVNLAGLMRAIRHARETAARRFIYASTGSVYSQTLRRATETEPIDLMASRNFYAASKLAAEALLGPFGAILPVIQLRIFMPYGPGQNPDMLIPSIIEKVRGGQPVALHGSDGLRANPVAVEEVAETIRRCLELSASTTLNVAGPEVVTLRTMAETIGSIVGRTPTFQIQDGVRAPVIVGDTARLETTLGWSPRIDFQRGLGWLAAGARHQAA